MIDESILGTHSDQISRSAVSDSLRPHESQHARAPCPSPTPGVHSDSRPSSQWHHPAISSSVIPFSSCPQSLSASESFPMSQLFSWGGQSTGVSALASFLPKKDLIIQCTKTWGVLSMRSTTEHLSHLTYKLINKPQFLLKYKRPIFGHPMNYGIWILLSLSAVTLVISRSSSIPLDSKVILKQRVKKAKCKITWHKG